MEQSSKPIETQMLVAFFDLTGYTRLAEQRSATDLFEIISQFFELVGDAVEKSGGTVVKFMGDAGLLVYSEERADDGVRALVALKKSADEWLEKKGIGCRMVIKCHFGPVVAGKIGSSKNKRFDVYGLTVNQAATLQSFGVSITPQLFRKLLPETRRLFKKHTPPVRYIPVEERHRE